MRTPWIAGAAVVLVVAAWIGWRVASDRVAVEPPQAVAGAAPASGAVTAIGSEPVDPAGLAAVAPAGRRQAARGTQSIRFRLHDAPAAGVSVLLLPWDDETVARAARRVGLDDTDLERRVRAVEVAAEGTLELPIEAFPVLVAARAPGSAPSGFLLPAAADLPLQLDLDPECTLSGTVVGTARTGVAGVRVTARREGTFELLYGTDPLDPDRIAAILFGPTVRTTDADGRYALAGLPAGDVLVTVESPRHPTDCVTVILPVTEPVDLLLAETGQATVQGTVQDLATGEPLGGVLVLAQERHGGMNVHVWGRSRTDAAGTFELAGVPCDLDGLSLRAVIDGHAVGARHLGALAAGERRHVELALHAECGTAGQARTPASTPVSGTLVSVYTAGDVVFVTEAIADVGGQFRLDGLQDGLAYVLVWLADGHEMGRGTFANLCSGDPLILELVPLAILEGKLQASQYPLRKPAVRLVREESSGFRRSARAAEVDPASGAFRFENVWSGVYWLEGEAEDYARARQEQIVVQAGAAPAPLEIPLQRGATLRGKVVDALRGAPVALATVSLTDRTCAGTVVGDLPPAAETDLQGNFALEHVPAGVEFSISVTHPDYGRSVRDVELRAADVSGWIDVLVTPGATVQVTILDFSGLPSRGITGTAYTAENHRYPGTAEGDHLVFRDLPPGRTQVLYALPRDGRIAYSRSFERFLDLAPGGSYELTTSLAGAGRIHGRFSGAALGERGRIWTIQAAPLGEATGSELVRVERHPEYEVTGLAPGRYWLRMYTEDAGPDLEDVRVVDVPEGGAVREDFDFPASGIEGRVTDDAGTPVVQGMVYMRRERDIAADGVRPHWRGAALQPDGSYALHGLAPDRYEWWARLPGYGFRHAFVAVPAADTVVRHDVVLEPAGELVVRVTGPDGAVLPQAAVTVSGADGARYPLKPVPERLPAEHVFERMAGGTFQVDVTAEPLFPSREAATCRAGRTTELAVRLRARGVLLLEFRRADGQRLAHLPFSLQDEATGTEVAAWLAAGQVTSATGALAADGEGGVRIEGLPTGDYRLAAEGVATSVRVAAGEPPAPEKVFQAL